jgi:hypothetical protein
MVADIVVTAAAVVLLGKAWLAARSER